MTAQAKVYAKSDTTVFYDRNLALVTKIRDSGEWNPHDLNQYHTGDFLGVTTGNVRQISGLTVLEIEHTYDHQYKVGGFIPISRWRPRTVILHVPQDQVTTDAPPTEQEKQAAKDAVKQKQNQQLIDGLNAGNPQLTAGKEAEGSSFSVIGYVLVGLLLLGTLIWALVSRRKSPGPAAPEVIVLPKGKRLQSPASNVPPSTPQS